MQHTNQFSTIEEALEDFRLGKPLIVADDEDRENEGDLICSAQFVTPELINFITKECRGLVCLAIDTEIAEKMDLPIGTVKSRIFFARQRLQKILKDYNR